MLRVMSPVCLLLLACACSQAQPDPPEQLTLPYWRDCLESYGGDVHDMADAVDEGDADAIVCTLALHEGRYVESHRRELLYRYYRATGREPEGLDASIRLLDRQELAIFLLNTHDFSPELDMFDTDFRNCPIYDPIARQLLLRVEAPEDRRCLPRRWGWR